MVPVAPLERIASPDVDGKKENEMSRAFTREIDDAPPPPVPERAVSAARNLVTLRGARQIEAAIADLDARLRRPADDDDIAALQRDLRYWHARHASMEIVDHATPPEAVRFGARVTIQRGSRRQRLTIVGEDEAEPHAGLLAWTSPLARALDDAMAGETVEFAAGGREETVVVIAIDAEG
jgi:transcription elongation GreA/GreB family factor